MRCGFGLVQDWDENEEMDDPEDKKPAGWDDIPKQIVDPDASKPDDWDDESDGEWEAPMIDNPAYKVSCCTRKTLVIVRLRWFVMRQTI